MPPVPDLRTSMPRSELLPILLRREITERISRTFFIKEANVLIYLFWDVIWIGDVEVGEHLRLDPAINGFHGRIVCWCASPGHGPGDIVHGKKLVIALGCINRTLIAMQNQLLFRILLLERNHVLQAIQIGHAITTFG